MGARKAVLNLPVMKQYAKRWRGVLSATPGLFGTGINVLIWGYVPTQTGFNLCQMQTLVTLRRA